ncbi:hypothetical protein ACOSQ4_006826 [Xanthoceras sorbifolium]
MGPAPIVSSHAVKYYMHFIDNYTRFIWIYPLTHKSQMKDVFLLFKNIVDYCLVPSLSLFKVIKVVNIKFFTHFFTSLVLVLDTHALTLISRMVLHRKNIDM